MLPNDVIVCNFFRIGRLIMVICLNNDAALVFSIHQQAKVPNISRLVNVEHFQITFAPSLGHDLFANSALFERNNKQPTEEKIQYSTILSLSLVEILCA